MLEWLGVEDEGLVQRLVENDDRPAGASPELRIDFRIATLHRLLYGHKTIGRFNNSLLVSFLEEHPAWGPQFRAAREALSAVFARQHRLAGCPLVAYG